MEGHRLWLTPEGAAFWEPGAVLFVADLHLGKDEVFRRNGIGIPLGPDDASYRQLEFLIGHLSARAVIVLGDIWHSAAASRGPAGARLESWSRRCGASLELILGNHDRGATAPPSVTTHEEGAQVGPFTICHIPPEDHEGPTVCGHVHPVVRLKGKHLKCFWQKGSRLVLPAFGGFTGGYSVSEEPGIKYVTTGKQVIKLPSVTAPW